MDRAPSRPPTALPPDLADLLQRANAKASTVIERGGPVADATKALTKAVALCSEGLPPTFLAETRAPLATLVGAWRRAGLPEKEFIEALEALADDGVDRIAANSERSPADQAVAAAAIFDASQLLIRRSQRTFRRWRNRSAADEAFSVAVFGEALGHEIRNRIHAARTALELLREPASLGEDDRTRLHNLLKDAVIAARRAVFDVRLVTAEDPRREVAVNVALHELLPRTVERHRVVSASAGIAVEIQGTIPAAHVDARRVQVILNNMLDVATRLLAEAGGSTLRVRTMRAEHAKVVEISVSGDLPFLLPGHEEVLFEADLIDIADGGTPTEPSHLGLWLTREAASKMGGDLLVRRDSSDTDDALIARIPEGKPRDPSS